MKPLLPLCLLALALTAQAQAQTLGLQVRALTAEEQKAAGARAGLMIEHVSGAASKAGVLSGDVVLAVNGDAVTDAEHWSRQVETGDDHLALMLLRHGRRLFVPVSLR